MPAELRREIERLHAALAEATSRARDRDERIRALAGELERARADARTDRLTGALNRLGLDEAFARDAARAERAGEPLALVVLDLDDFKRLNDERGHAAGDRALALLVRLARQAMRTGDAIARLGGEEFGLLLPGADAASARAVTERLCERLAAESTHLGAPAGALTFSAGLAMRETGETLAAMIERADQALYEAKRQGKRRLLEAGRLAA